MTMTIVSWILLPHDNTHRRRLLQSAALAYTASHSLRPLIYDTQNIPAVFYPAGAWELSRPGCTHRHHHHQRHRRRRRRRILSCNLVVSVNSCSICYTPAICTCNMYTDAPDPHPPGQFPRTLHVTSVLDRTPVPPRAAARARAVRVVPNPYIEQHAWPWADLLFCPLCLCGQQQHGLLSRSTLFRYLSYELLGTVPSPVVVTMLFSFSSSPFRETQLDVVLGTPLCLDLCRGCVCAMGAGIVLRELLTATACGGLRQHLSKRRSTPADPPICTIFVFPDSSGQLSMAHLSIYLCVCFVA
ncbi:hypothetical protein C8Q76DRAFT_49762 [Earliella scabrosa]|nr:hypothetical protein C8Q76DRAFT_49762 [Earliella scabrosa]